MIYANVVAKYCEGRLLDAEKLRRISEADYFGALRMLYDYGYGEGVPIETADAKTLADAETRKLVEFVEEYGYSDRLKRFLLLRYLYNNAKSAVKSRFTTVEESAYFPFFVELTQEIKEGKYENAGEYLKKALEKIDGLVTETNNPSSIEIDNILNDAYYNELYFLAKKIGKQALSFVTYMIDKNNLFTVFRAKKAGLGVDEMEKMILPHGKIGKDTLVELYSVEGETAKELLPEYEEEIGELLSGDFALYEKNADDRLNLKSVRDKEDMLSVDPFIGYFFAKRREIDAVKLILTCIKNDAREELRRRLRNLDE